ncbi:hypothetical protein WSM22_19220 [Cytophagales bacterium WSM2-2]|nr:hypothetical protein WSM22_19220 [Cytophagales bacterium WSM2-2]
MNINELSDNELNIFQQVISLCGTMEEKSKQLKDSGTFDKYREIHNQYLRLINTTEDKEEFNEALKRLIFLNWYHMMEPSCFTGLWELDGDTIHESYLHLNDYLKTNKADGELKWMVSYYSHNDWTILLYSEKEMPELTAFVKSVDRTKSHLPDKDVLAKTMIDRGQMGKYFASM